MPLSLGWQVLDEKEHSLNVESFKPLQKDEDFLKKALDAYKEGNASIEDCLLLTAKKERLLLSKDKFKQLSEIARKHLQGFGPFEYFLNDENIEEICVTGINKPLSVYVKNKGWLEANVAFTSQEAAINFINKMAREVGKHVSFQSPRLNAMLPNGQRLHATIPPISKDVEITIRRFQKQPINALDLLKNTTISTEALAFLATALPCDLNVVIAGNTGSGKTSTLNAMLSFLPLNDRVVAIEETRELRIPQTQCVSLTTSKELEISMQDLIEDTLRMRPDRQVIGEVRSKQEIQAMFNALLAGQARGTLATMHAQSSEELLKRLKAMDVLEEDLSILNLIIIQRRIPIIASNGSGKIMEVRRITEITEFKDGKLKKIFQYNAKKDKLEKASEPELLDRIALSYCMPKESLKELIESRKRKLEKMANERQAQDFQEVTRKLQAV